MKKDTIAILVLCCSAMVLVALLVGAYTSDAQAGSSSAKGGDYVLQTTAMSAKVDMVTVVDVDAQVMMVYVPDKTGTPTQLTVGDKVDLARAFGDRGGPVRRP